MDRSCALQIFGTAFFIWPNGDLKKNQSAVTKSPAEQLILRDKTSSDSVASQSDVMKEHISESEDCLKTLGLDGTLLALGGVDKVPDPEADGCDEDEAEEAVGGLVVSGCQSSAVFQL